MHSWEEGLCIRCDSLLSNRTYRTFQATPPELFTMLPNKRQSGVTDELTGLPARHFARLFLFLIQPRSLLLSLRSRAATWTADYSHHTKTRRNSATFTATNKASVSEGEERDDRRSSPESCRSDSRPLRRLLRPRSISSESLSLLCKISRQW